MAFFLLQYSRMKKYNPISVRINSSSSIPKITGSMCLSFALYGGSSATQQNNPKPNQNRSRLVYTSCLLSFCA
ncbi:hypothetical protein BJX99DRAFT_115991 [Aspergillus californicus]